MIIPAITTETEIGTEVAGKILLCTRETGMKGEDLTRIITDLETYHREVPITGMQMIIVVPGIMELEITAATLEVDQTTMTLTEVLTRTEEDMKEEEVIMEIMAAEIIEILTPGLINRIIMRGARASVIPAFMAEDMKQEENQE